MADLFLKLLVETTGSSANTGKKYAYYTSSLVQDTDGSLGAKEVWRRIQLLPSCSYEDGSGPPISYKAGHTLYTGRSVLSSSYAYASGETSGSEPGPIIFHDKENGGYNIVRYKFYGPGVCGALGFADGVWNYPERFQLAERDDYDNSFTGDLQSDTLFVKKGLRFSSMARVKGNMTFDATGSANTGISFVGHEAGEPKMLAFMQLQGMSASLLPAREADNSHTGHFNIYSFVNASNQVNTRDIKYLPSVNGHGMFTKGGEASNLCNLRIHNIYGLNSTGSRQGIGITDYEGFEMRLGNAYLDNTAVLGYPLGDKNDGTNWTNVSAANALKFLHVTSNHNSLYTNGDTVGVAFVFGKRVAQNTAAGSEATAWTGSAFHIYPTRPYVGAAAGSNQIQEMKVHMPLLASTLESSGSATIGNDLDVSGDLTAATITMSGKIDTSGEVEAEHLHSTDDVEVGHAIYHSGDTNTQIIFTTDAIEFEAGGVEFFRIVESTNDNLVVNEGSADVNFRVESNSYTTMFKVDAGLNKIGINEGTPASLLHIQQDTDGDDGGIRLYNNQDGTYWSIRVNTSEYLYFNYNGTSNGGRLQHSDVGQITFTGQHRSSPSTGTVDNYTSSIGYIVCADGTYDNLWDNNDKVKQDTRPNINESIPRVKLSNKSKDKTVFGVISECEVITEQTTTSESIEVLNDPTDPDTKIRTVTSSSAYTREFSQGAFTTIMEASSSADQKLVINSLGEGAVWVCNISGSIENGDYITSSPIEGLGMKQDDDLLHNYTVAKITQDCTFDLAASASYDCVEFNWSGSAYRKAFVGCTYHCG